MAGQTRAGVRVYEELKGAILKGQLRLRERLEVEAIARAMRVSATPVRHALAQLSAERLVIASPARGYRVAFWSERGLRALYEWRGALALMSLETFVPASELLSPVRVAPYEDALHAVFQRLGEGANEEVRRAALNADERLYATRAVEPEVLEGAMEEFATLAHALLEPGSRRAKMLLKSFHRRRIERAEAVRKRAAMRALPPNGD